MVPFYVQISMNRVAPTTSFMAEIVLELSGFAYATVYTFFRCNPNRLVARRSATLWAKKQRLRLFGPKDLNTTMVISTPLLVDRNDSPTYTALPNESPVKLTNPIRNSTDPRLQQTTFITPEARQSLATLQIAKASKTQRRPPQIKSTYSFFPTAASNRHLSMSTATSTSDDEIITHPVPMFSRKHRRDESSNTTETVQIGMRLSHAIADTVADTVSSSASLQIPVQSVPIPTTPSEQGPPGQISMIDSLSPKRSRPPISQSQSEPLLRSSRIATPAIRSRPKLPRTRLMKSLPPIPEPLVEAQPSGLRLNPPGDENWPVLSFEARPVADWI